MNDITATDVPEDVVFETLMQRRFTCRGYQGRPVAQAVIDRIVALARLTPSWCNTQPWQLVITSGSETQRFTEALYGHAVAAAGCPLDPDLAFPVRYSGEYDVRRKVVGAQLYASVGIERGDKAAALAQGMENFRAFGAPHVAILTSDRELGPYGALDCGAFLQSFLLAACSLGVATTPQAALASYPAFVRDHFGIADDRMILCGIAFGYPDDQRAINQFRAGRAAVADIADFRS